MLPAWAGLLAKQGSGPPPGFSNTLSYLNSGTTTANASYINLGQPAVVYVAPNANELAIAFWYRHNGRDGILVSNRIDSSAGLHLAISSGVLNGFVGGNFLSGGSGLGDGNWHFIVLTVRNEAGTYVARIFVDGNTTSVASANAGAVVNTGIDLLVGHRRGSDNSTMSFGAYTNAYYDELTIWSVGMTGTQAAELYNGGVPADPTTHSQAASLAHWYRMGDGDSSPTVSDNVGSQDGTIINTGTGGFASVVP